MRIKLVVTNERSGDDTRTISFDQSDDSDYDAASMALLAVAMKPAIRDQVCELAWGPGWRTVVDPR